jgi:GDP-mannose transporter
MFNGTVTGLTMCSFALMVGSSVIAAWADISAAWAVALDPTTGREILNPSTGGYLGSINVGYIWMGLNCLVSAAYVSRLHSMKGCLLIPRSYS